MPQFFLGVDGGQSSTIALIGDERGVVIGYGAAGPSNHVAGPGGPARLRQALLTSVSAAWNNSPFGGTKGLPQFESAFFGMAGGAEDKVVLIRQWISARRLEVSHDAAGALIGATEGRPGIIVVAGTGSIAFGMNGRGKTARAGGWGYLIGDAGSGLDLARSALVAALRHEEGWGPPTKLRERLLAFTGATGLNEALHKWYTAEFPRERVASFSRQVDEAARAGDRVAREILRSGAGELAQLVARVRRRIFRPREHALVSYSGGVFKSTLVRDRFRRLVGQQGYHRVLPPALAPATGALLAAYCNAGRADVKLRNVPPEL